jgi:hypothetical protein
VERLNGFEPSTSTLATESSSVGKPWYRRSLARFGGIASVRDYRPLEASRGSPRRPSGQLPDRGPAPASDHGVEVTLLRWVNAGESLRETERTQSAPT